MVVGQEVQPDCTTTWQFPAQLLTIREVALDWRSLTLLHKVAYPPVFFTSQY